MLCYDCAQEQQDRLYRRVIGGAIGGDHKWHPADPQDGKAGQGRLPIGTHKRLLLGKHRNSYL
jgi:hypothetical protein